MPNIRFRSNPTRAHKNPQKELSIKSTFGHVDFGVKWQIMPLCLKGNFTPIMPLFIKGKFYAKAVVVYITTAFYTIEFGIKSPCEESWPPLQKLRENFTPTS